MREKQERGDIGLMDSTYKEEDDHLEGENGEGCAFSGKNAPIDTPDDGDDREESSKVSGLTTYQDGNNNRKNASGMRYNTRDKKALMQKINELSNTAHMEIFRILKRKRVSHTQNKNGMFVNLSVVDDDLLDEISSFVDYCIDNSRDLENYDKMLNTCRTMQRVDGVMFSNNNGKTDMEQIQRSDGHDHDDDIADNIRSMNNTNHGIQGYSTNDTLYDTEKENSADRRGEHQNISATSTLPPSCHIEVTTENAKEKQSKTGDVDVGEDDTEMDDDRSCYKGRDEISKEEAECVLNLRSIIHRESDKTVSRRRANTKFALARKRFGKKKNVDKRSCAFDTEMTSELTPESYPI